MSINVGDLMLNQQFSPGINNDPYNTPSYSPTPIDVIQAQQIFAQFSKYLSGTQLKLTANTVGPDNIMSTIALSPEAILISASKIGIVGEVTFTDWLRDVNGVSTGVLDPSITTIRGGVIHTGIIYNADNSNYLDLDATGTTPFLVSSSGVSIKANGQFTLGATTGKQLIWDGTNLSIGNNALLNTTPVSTVLSGSSLGATAMQANLANVLSGAGAVQYGSVSWSSGVASGTSAVAISANGIAGFSSTGAGFYISATTGNAVFTGSITGGANINITGEGVFGGATTTGSYNGAVFANYNGGSTGAATNGVVAWAGSGTAATAAAIFGIAPGAQSGVMGAASGGRAIFGQDSSSGYGGYFLSSTGTALYVQTQSGTANPVVVISGSAGFTAIQTSGIIQSTLATGTAPFSVASTTQVANLSAQYWGGVGFNATTTGTATATFSTTNKPGSNSTNSWLPLTNTSGTVIGYLPYWT